MTIYYVREMTNGAVLECDVREAASVLFMCKAGERSALTLMMKCAGHADRRRQEGKMENVLFHCHVAAPTTGVSLFFFVLFLHHAPNFIKIM